MSITVTCSALTSPRRCACARAATERVVHRSSPAGQPDAPRLSPVDSPHPGTAATPASTPGPSSDDTAYAADPARLRTGSPDDRPPETGYGLLRTPARTRPDRPRPD